MGDVAGVVGSACAPLSPYPGRHPKRQAPARAASRVQKRRRRTSPNGCRFERGRSLGGLFSFLGHCDHQKITPAHALCQANETPTRCRLGGGLIVRREVERGVGLCHRAKKLTGPPDYTTLIIRPVNGVYEFLSKMEACRGSAWRFSVIKIADPRSEFGRRRRLIRNSTNNHLKGTH